MAAFLSSRAARMAAGIAQRGNRRRNSANLKENSALMAAASAP